MSEISELMLEYDRLASGLCLSARADKMLPDKDAQRVLQLIDQIRDIYTKQDSVLRQHVWILTYLFPAILSESEHCRDTTKRRVLENYAWDVQWRVSKIFEPNRNADLPTPNQSG